MGPGPRRDGRKGAPTGPGGPGGLATFAGRSSAEARLIRSRISREILHPGIRVAPRIPVPRRSSGRAVDARFPRELPRPGTDPSTVPWRGMADGPAAIGALESLL